MTLIVMYFNNSLTIWNTEMNAIDKEKNLSNRLMERARGSCKEENMIRKGVRTKHGPGVHGPPLWTGSMDHFHGPGPWTPCHGPGPWTVFFYFYRKVLHQVHGHSKTEKVPKKDFTRHCQPMHMIDHKYLVALT